MIVVERKVRLSGGELSLRVEIPDDADEDPEGDALITALLRTVAEFTGDGPVVEWKLETPDSGDAIDHTRLGHCLSTYCLHERHDDCRLVCKVCEAPCRCACHSTDRPDVSSADDA